MTESTGLNLHSRQPRCGAAHEQSAELLPVVLAWRRAESGPGIGFTAQRTPAQFPTDTLVLLPQEGHIMVVGHTGSGKGLGYAVPLSLTYPGQMWTVDPKGENYQVTARRRRELGQLVVKIDPMQVVDEHSGSLNPMDLLDPESPSVVDDAAALVNSLAADLSRDDRDRFWSGRAEHLLIGLVIYVLEEYPKSKRSLSTVRELLESGIADPARLAKRLSTCANEEVRLIASTLLIGANNTLGGILAFAQAMLEFLRGDPIRDATSTTTFDLDAVVRGDPLSIYLVLPPHMLSSHGKLLRLWLTTLLTCVTRRRARPTLSTLLQIDEAATVGPLKQYVDAVVLMRAYGLQTVSYWQDLSQTRATYPNAWQTLINNCHAVIFLGAANLAAAGDIVNAIGWDRPPSDILRLSARGIVLQVHGQEPCLARRPDYLQDLEYAGLFDPNPLHDGGCRGLEPRVRAKLVKRQTERAEESEPAGDRQGPEAPSVPAVLCEGLHELLSGRDSAKG